MGKAQLIHVRVRCVPEVDFRPLYEFRRQRLSEAEHLPVEVLSGIDHWSKVIDSHNGQSPTHSHSCAVRPGGGLPLPIRAPVSECPNVDFRPPTRLSALNNSSAGHPFVMVLYTIDHLIVLIESINGYRPYRFRSRAVSVQKWTPGRFHDFRR